MKDSPDVQVRLVRGERIKFSGFENASPDEARGLTPRFVQRAMIESHAHQTQI
jgi:hypothetical protein